MIENTFELEQAEQALTAFEARNELAILRDELSINKENHERYLRKLESIDIIIRDLAGFRNNLTTRSRTEPAAFADQLSLISLQNAAYNAGEGLGVILQLQESSAFEEQSVGQQIQTVDNLISMLEEKKVSINERIEEIQPLITQLQAEISEVDTEQTHLNRELELLRFLDTTLTRKFEEVKLSNNQTPRIFRNAGRAIPPFKPAGPRKLIPTVLITVATGLLVVGVILFREYWQSDVRNEKNQAAKMPMDE
jgi:hypothetical protein